MSDIVTSAVLRYMHEEFLLTERELNQIYQLKNILFLLPPLTTSSFMFRKVLKCLQYMYFCFIWLVHLLYSYLQIYKTSRKQNILLLRKSSFQVIRMSLFMEMGTSIFLYLVSSADCTIIFKSMKRTYLYHIKAGRIIIFTKVVFLVDDSYEPLYRDGNKYFYIWLVQLIYSYL